MPCLSKSSDHFQDDLVGLNLLIIRIDNGYIIEGQTLCHSGTLGATTDYRSGVRFMSPFYGSVL
jgi:hypothetical protein